MVLVTAIVGAVLRYDKQRILVLWYTAIISTVIGVVWAAIGALIGRLFIVSVN